MELHANENKNVEIDVNGKIYNRYAIKTHYVQLGEDYIELIKKYISPIYKDGDIITISEKIISMCQKNIIYKKDMKVSKLARFLSKFAMKTEAGIGANSPYKMQFAIDLCGSIKVIYASIVAGIGKLFHKKGVFYKIVGKEVSELDGFYGKNFPEYADFGIMIPKDPDGVCKKIYDETGVNTVIIDANDFEVDILGKSKNIQLDNNTLRKILKDNPAGQSNQQTPMVLIRKN